MCANQSVHTCKCYFYCVFWQRRRRGQTSLICCQQENKPWIRHLILWVSPIMVKCFLSSLFVVPTLFSESVFSTFFFFEEFKLSLREFCRSKCYTSEVKEGETQVIQITSRDLDLYQQFRSHMSDFTLYSKGRRLVSATIRCMTYSWYLHSSLYRKLLYKHKGCL